MAFSVVSLTAIWVDTVFLASRKEALVCHEEASLSTYPLEINFDFVIWCFTSPTKNAPILVLRNLNDVWFHKNKLVY